MTGVEERLLAIELQLESANEKLNAVYATVCGNGDEDKSHVVRLDRVERIAKCLVWCVTVAILAVVGVVAKSFM